MPWRLEVLSPSGRIAVMQTYNECQCSCPLTHCKHGAEHSFRDMRHDKNYISQLKKKREEINSQTVVHKTVIIFLHNFNKVLQQNVTELLMIRLCNCLKHEKQHSNISEIFSAIYLNRHHFATCKHARRL